MTDIPAEAAKAAAQATGATEAKKPQPLTGGEKAAATCLYIAGLIVIGLTLFAFSSTDADFTFKAKEKTVTEPLTGATGSTGAASAAVRTTQEIDYSDTVAIFALTVGAALTLAGGFFGRIRSLKLGGLELGIVGPDDLKAAADRAVEEVEKQNIPDADKKETAKAVAQQVAVADLTRAAALGIQPTEEVIEGIATQAATKVTDAIA